LSRPNLVHTGDPLIVVDRLAANPCYSRPAPPSQTERRQEIDRSPVPTPAGPPVVVNGYPVVSAAADDEDAASWIVICRRTGRMPDWANGTGWYVTWRAWWANGRWNGENGDYGPHHGLTWSQAQQSLARRVNLPAPRPAADPDVYLHSDDDSDSWNCPSCRRPIVEVFGGDTIGALLAEIADHRCAPAASTCTPDPRPATTNK
jgi:hypothetical protein